MGADFGPEFRQEREVRFAVVMYGGVSLAIYINGVVQELLRLVRATAPVDRGDGSRSAWFPHDDLKGSERVYRALGQLPVGAGQKAPAPGNAPIRTRFVVDILAGTSAGGINAVFLAKALANGQKIDALKRLWVEEGDIARLLNDRRSAKGVDEVQVKEPPESLLNGDRLYEVALNALAGMDATVEERRDGRLPSYAEEIDLAVTTTDLQGLKLPIRLSDRVVPERRHRYVLRFKHSTQAATGEKREHFRGNDRMLAFAARCTSSFPFAFEPALLDDIKRKGDTGAWPQAEWDRFFLDYVEHAVAYNRWAFADGGYLDNKPFTAATRLLRRRRADVPVDRKLIYLEPDPTEAGWGPSDPQPPAQEPDPRPDALQNVAASLSLPRFETIREDIAEVVARNREIERIERVTQAVGPRVPESARGGPEDPAVAAAYWELRTEIVIDDLAAVVVGATSLQLDTEPYHVVRLLIRSWLTASSARERLLKLDLSFHQRRIYFLHDRINDLLRTSQNRSADTSPAVADRLREVKAELNEVLRELRSRARAVRRARAPQAARPSAKSSPGEAPLSGLTRLIEELGISDDELLRIAAAADPGARAKEWVRRLEPGFTAIAGWLAADFEPRLARAEQRVRSTLPSAGVGRVLLRDFETFERFNAVLLPLTYPGLEEARPVDVLRVSPEDARSLLGGAGRRRAKEKLAGARLHHFGGFLDERWRRNDLLWGRLDAAERILSLVPSQALREELLEQAQAAIIREELLGGDGDAGALTDEMVRALGGVGSPGLEPEELVEALDGKGRSAILATMRKLPDKTIVAHFKDHYRTPTELDGEAMLSAAGRGIRITSDVLGESSRKHGAPWKPWFWLSRIGRLLTGFAELLVPKPSSPLHQRLRRNPVQVALVVAIFLVLSGVLGVEGAQKAGWILLGAVAGGAALVSLTRGLLHKRSRVLALAVALIALTVAGLAALEVGAHLEDDVVDALTIMPGNRGEGVERYLVERVDELWPW